MEALFFWIFSIGLILSGLGVILNRNPVASALCLVMTIVFLAALFFTLQAYFLGVVQILVYAGAVMVLFLFIIMLLDLKAEQKRQFKIGAMFAGAVVAGALCVEFSLVLPGILSGVLSSAALEKTGDDVPVLGRLLFNRYLLPFEVTSVLLLVALIGVILLSRREDK